MCSLVISDFRCGSGLQQMKVVFVIAVSQGREQPPWVVCLYPCWSLESVISKTRPQLSCCSSCCFQQVLKHMSNNIFVAHCRVAGLRLLFGLPLGMGSFRPTFRLQWAPVGGLVAQFRNMGSRTWTFLLGLGAFGPKKQESLKIRKSHKRQWIDETCKCFTWLFQNLLQMHLF